jgi:DNA-binding CsgD family transcriptional regulator
VNDAKLRNLYLYRMLQILIYMVFIISVALAAAGITISTKLRNRSPHQAFSTLLYFQVFIYAFGFYGIWGHAAIKVFLEPYIPAGLMVRIVDLLLLMGLPFLVFAWLMLMNLALDLGVKKRPGWFTAVFLTINFAALLTGGYFFVKNGAARPVSEMKLYFIIPEVLYSLAASILILSGGKGHSLVSNFDRRIIGLSISGAMIISCIPLLFYSSQLFPAIIFILAFFAGYSFIPAWLYFATLLPYSNSMDKEELSLDELCSKFEVSPRETDIIREICKGLSNKEISEKLFISLQTVKDHTHRIYVKTNVRSRVQLINLVKDSRERSAQLKN